MSRLRNPREKQRMARTLPFRDTDPTDAALEALNGHTAMLQLAGDLRTLGLGLRLVPASCAPDATDRSRVSAWLLENEPEMWIGVTDQARPGHVARVGARMLILLRGAMTIGAMTEHSGAASDAAVESAVFQWLSDSDLYSEVLTSARVFLTRLAKRGNLTSARAREASLHLWSVLVVLDEVDRRAVFGHCAALAPGCAHFAEGLLKRCPVPATAVTAREVGLKLANEK